MLSFVTFFTNLHKQSAIASYDNPKRNFIVIFRINPVSNHQIFLFDTRIFLFVHPINHNAAFSGTFAK